MQSVSPAYREAMAQTLRNRGYAQVSIGLFNQVAQNSAEISPDDMSYLAQTATIFDTSRSIDHPYGTLEQDCCLPNVTLFTPRTGPGRAAHAGLISEDVIDSEPYTLVITITDGPVSFSGLTLNFGPVWMPVPTVFEVTTDTGLSFEITDNTDARYVIPDTFTDVSEITITISQMNKSGTRFRLTSIGFGQGISFNNETIKSVSVTEYTDGLAIDNFQRTAVLKLSNQDHAYDIENPSSIINFVGSGQPMSVQFGYDTGSSVYWLTPWEMTVSEVSVGGEEVTIDAYAGEDWDEVYDDGTVYNYPTGVSYGTLALILGGGVASGSQIASRMNDYKTLRPLPIDTRRNLAKMVANACGCLWTVDRQGEWYFLDSPMHLSNPSNFTYAKDDMMTDPIVTKSKQLKDVTVVYRPLISRLTDQTIDLGEIEVIEGESITFDHPDQIYHTFSPTIAVELDGVSGEATLLKQSAARHIIQFNVSGTYHVQIKHCHVYTFDTRYYTLNVNATGESVVWDNPLIDKLSHAQDLAQWIADYYDVLCGYEYDTRGNPEVDVADLVYQENDYVQNMKVYLEEITTSFDGAFHGHVKTRRLE